MRTSSIIRSGLIGLVLFALPVATTSPRPARADAVSTAPGSVGGILSVDTANSSLTYHLVHKFHKIDGTSNKIEGRARITLDGKAQVDARAAAESFDSGNSNRDAHMKEVIEAAKFPTVELKAASNDLTPPATFPTTVEKKFQGELLFHGIKLPIEVPAKLTFEAANRVKVVVHFTISLDAYKVERPSLMFVKVDDALAIDGSLIFKG